MTNEDKILLFLFENRHIYCDDCLSKLCGVTPRQQVNQICREVRSINRQKSICHSCRKTKIGNSLYQMPGEPLALMQTAIENKGVQKNMRKVQGIGFLQKAGHWLFVDKSLDFKLERFDDCNDVLYAFVVNDSIKYIGKSTNTLQQRMQQYKTPGSDQSTNIRNNGNIKRELEAGRTVEIYAFVDSGLFSYGGFRINLTLLQRNG